MPGRFCHRWHIGSFSRLFAARKRFWYRCHSGGFCELTAQSAVDIGRSQAERFRNCKTNFHPPSFWKPFLVVTAQLHTENWGRNPYFLPTKRVLITLNLETITVWLSFSTVSVSLWCFCFCGVFQYHCEEESIKSSACLKFIVQIASFWLMTTASNVQCDPVLLVLRTRSVALTLNLRLVLPMLISNLALNFTKIPQKYRQPLFQFHL